MKKIIVVGIFFCYGVKTNAQTNNINFNSSTTMHAIQFNSSSNSTYNVLSGSPYTNPEFQPGRVMLVPVKWVDSKFLRLNTYTHVLEYVEDDILKAANVKQIKAFEINGKKYKSGFQPIDKQTLDSYYQIIYEGNCKVLKYTNTIMEPVKAADDTKEGDKFTTTDYFYLLQNDKLSKFAANKKSILKLVSSENSGKLEKFLNENNFKFKEDKDFSELGKFIDSL